MFSVSQIFSPGESWPNIVVATFVQPSVFRKMFSLEEMFSRACPP